MSLVNVLSSSSFLASDLVIFLGLGDDDVWLGNSRLFCCFGAVVVAASAWTGHTVLNKSWKARRSAADGPSGCAHLVSPAPPAGTVLPSPEAGPWSIDRLDSRYPSPQTVELCSTRARSSVPKVIYNGAAKHVFCNALSREPVRGHENSEPQQQIAYVPRLKYAIGNLGSQTQGECPIKAPDILRQPVMLLHVAKQKAVLSRESCPI